MKILFMGTPDIAADALTALHAAGHDILGAVCQGDKPKGRGHRMMPPPVKERALSLGIPVYQPERVRDEAFIETVSALAPDACVVVAYGKILPSALLSLPKYGCFNLHVSLLPAYRGAAPMQRALMNGERETGVCVMYMDEGLDTGDILACERFDLTEDDDFGTLYERSTRVGSELLVRALDMIEKGTAPREKQSEYGVSYAEKITEEDLVLNLSQPATVLAARVRGLSPMPLARLRLPGGRSLKVVKAKAQPEGGDKPCGTVTAVSGKGDGYIDLQVGEGTLRLLRVKPEGKGEMSAGDFVRGRGIAPFDVITSL